MYSTKMVYFAAAVVFCANVPFVGCARDLDAILHYLSISKTVLYNIQRGTQTTNSSSSSSNSSAANVRIFRAAALATTRTAPARSPTPVGDTGMALLLRVADVDSFLEVLSATEGFSSSSNWPCVVVIPAGVNFTAATLVLLDEFQKVSIDRQVFFYEEEELGLSEGYWVNTVPVQTMLGQVYVNPSDGFTRFDVRMNM